MSDSPTTGEAAVPTPAPAPAVEATGPAAGVAARRCTWCGAEGKLKRCGGCRAAWFCDNNKACLREAWVKGGHKQVCLAAQAARGQSRKQVGSLPPALKVAPSWSMAPPASATSQHDKVTPTFDYLPLDEDDQCGICLGDHLPRNGVGVVSLSCKGNHRYHRACVAALRRRQVVSPCTVCDPPEPPPPWEDAVRKFARIELLVEQGRADWESLSEEQTEDIDELVAQLRAEATEGRETAAALLEGVEAARQAGCRAG